ncbi:MAG: efflux RND transporter permease subunit [Gammaproteobacteria bacterium]|nr:efflux RND transporter permease subunit [Gammaproteobacteria bacterium]
MKLPQFCIERPVFATVLSLILIMIGIMGFQKLETRFLPRFALNRVVISTSYPGASANLVETSITTPLEKSISGIDGIDYVSSDSSQGASTITVILDSGSNLFNLTNKIRNQIALTTSTLPTGIQAPIVQTGHGEMDLMDIGFSIQGGKLKDLRDYLDRYVIDRITQLPGISSVETYGANKYAMRITLHPSQMAARNVNINDIQTAINNNNLQLPAGYIKSPTMDFPITAKTALHTADQFGNIVVKNTNGQLIYLKDIASVKLGNNTDLKSIVKVNGKPAILLSTFNTDESNPIAESKKLRALLKNIGSQLPSNIHYKITFDSSKFMSASISEVYKTISISVAFVSLIIFFSLGKFRSALIPIVTIPICILATMGFMYFVGFSINIITLLAIVLSIGLVVDDSIVVLENIHRHMENGLSRMDAAIKGSQEIATPVIAMTLTLAAVYAPIGLITGVVAHIFASFAFTLAIAVIISGFVALTLSPMMCSKFLTIDGKQETEKNTRNKLTDNIEKFFHRLTTFYRKLLTGVLLHRFKIIVVTVILAIGGFILGSTLQKTFLPKEDMGFLVTALSSPPGNNDQYSEIQLQQLNSLLFQHPAIENNVTMSLEQSDHNMIFSTLKDYSQRNQSATQLALSVNNQIKKIPGLNAVAFPPSFGGSTQNEIAFYIMAPENYNNLYTISNDLIKKLSNYPGLINLQSNLKFNNQQYNLTVNRQLADQLQVSVRDIDTTLASLLGGTTVSTFNLNGETYDVDMQAAKPYLQSTQAIQQFTVPNSSGKLVPLANLITMTPIPMQTNLFHYNRLRAAEITGELGPGYPLGKVVDYLQKTLPQILPSDVKYAFTGQARRIVSSSNSMGTIFLLSFVFIYLVLSAQFESFIDPFIILLAVPLSIIGALVSLKIVNGSINLYTTISLITLVGLIAKHGILITQFANTLQKTGKNAHDALIDAASIRLRPILMTTAAMICGALPLIFATGASANSRMQVGTVFVGGLICGTFFSLVLVPIAYSYFNQLKRYIAGKHAI